MLRVEQLAIDASFLEVWLEIIRSGGYDHFRIAVVGDQPNPILILCTRAENDPLGPGCVGGDFWFSAPRVSPN